MKIVQINTVPTGSTGNIMMNIHKYLIKNGYESYVIWGRGRKPNNKNEIQIGNKLSVYFHAIYSRLTGKTGFGSKLATKKLILKLDKITPDIIHLHNIHGYYINIDLLFNYIKKKNIRVVWTLHDCWPFTGHCTHFDSINCEKWKKQCCECPIKNEYPKSLVDNSAWCFTRKKDLFTSIKNMKIITPSEWLADNVKKSFLSKYDIKVINNGIDNTIFKKLDESKLNFRSKYNLFDKKIILGVASPFTHKKGFDDYIELSKILDDRFIIVLVGLNKKQIKILPKNMIGLKKTSNVHELVDIYNSADVYLNLSVEETFGLTCIEAFSCGTPCIAYNKTALSEIARKNSGLLIEKKDNSIIEIKKILESEEYNLADISKLSIYSIEKMIQNYINVYNCAISKR